MGSQKVWPALPIRSPARQKLRAGFLFVYFPFHYFCTTFHICHQGGTHFPSHSPAPSACIAGENLSPMKLHFLTLPVICLLLCCACRKVAPGKSAEAADSLLSASTDLVQADPRRADSLYIALQHELRDSTAWYKTQVFRGTARMFMGDSTEARRLYESVEQWCRRTPGSRLVEGTLYNHYSATYIQHGFIDRGAECVERAFALLNYPPKGQELISTTINLADTHFQRGDIPKAAYYYRYALSLSDSLHRQQNVIPILCGLAQVYMQLENFNEGRHYLDRARKGIGRESIQTQYYFYYTEGSFHYFAGEYAQAIPSFLRALRIAESIGQPIQLVHCEGNLGETYLMLDSLDAASRHLSRCTALIARLGKDASPAIISYVQSLRADLALAQGREDEARQLLDAPLVPSMKESPRYLMLHYKRLQKYAARDGRWKQAYELQTLGTRYADSLRSRQAANTVAELTMRYTRDTLLTHQRIVQADYRTRNARQQMWLTATIAGAVILALATALLIMANRRRTRRRLRQSMEEIHALRMSLVRNRVSPHYIFNVLGIVLPKLRNYPEIDTPIDLLIDVLRGNLLSSSRDSTPLHDEITLVRNFVQLYHYTKGPHPRVEWQIDENLAHSLLPIFPMSLQIPVENALKHAFPKPDESSRIRISINLDARGLHLEVSDNGIGYRPAQEFMKEHSTGLGLHLLSQSILILNRHNSLPASLRIATATPPAHGTTVTLLIPPGYRFDAETPDD